MQKWTIDYIIDIEELFNELDINKKEKEFIKDHLLRLIISNDCHGDLLARNIKDWARDSAEYYESNLSDQEFRIFTKFIHMCPENLYLAFSEADQFWKFDTGW